MSGRPSVEALLLADGLARRTTRAERTALTHLLASCLAGLLPAGALEHSLAVCTHPIELAREHLERRALAPGSHWVTHKIDGENFTLVYMPASIASALGPRVGEKRIAATAATTAASVAATATATAATAASAEHDAERSTRGLVFLIGRGDSPANERSFVLTSARTLVFNMRRRTDEYEPLDTPAIYDGELALRRRFTHEESARERERSRALYAWDATPALEHALDARADAGVERGYSLVYAVADCLYSGRTLVAHELLQVRLATAKLALLGPDARRPPLVTSGTPARLELVYKPHVPGNHMHMLVRDIAEPALVGCNFDGLILTSALTPFRLGTDERLFKLKPPGLKTLDFRVAPLASTGHLRMFTCALGACRRAPCAVHAVGDAEERAFTRAGVPLAPNAIIEFAPAYAAASAEARARGHFAWVPIRARPDKSRPNARRTVESTFAALRNAVSYEEACAALALPH